MKKANAKKKSAPAKNRKPAAKAPAKQAKSKAKAKSTAKQVAAAKAKVKAKAAVKTKTAAKAKPATKKAAKATKATTRPKAAVATRSAGGAKRTAATAKQAAPNRQGVTAAAVRASAKATQSDSRSTDGLNGALAALKLGLEKKAVEPMLLDLRDLCSYTNYRLLLSGRSDRQVDAIADGVVAGLRDAGFRHLSKERTDARSWTLIDFGDFIVDVFHHPSREHYDLESLWNDAPRVAIDIPADARLGAAEAYA